MRFLVKRRFSSKLLLDLTWWTVVFLGIALRLRQYLANRSLWIDEASLALNIVHRNFIALTHTLDFEQGAPLGFLFLEKAILLVLGNQDYILRLVPLISGLLAVYVLYRIARDYFGIAGLFALAFFAVSWSLIYYSSELKQYSSDILVSAGLIYLALRAKQKEAGHGAMIALGLSGLVSIWLSFPAIFVLASVGLALAGEYLSRKAFRLLYWMLGIGMLWLANFFLLYWLSLRHLMNDSYLLKFWHGYFMPLPPWDHWSWFGSIYLHLLNLPNSISFGAAGYFAWMCSILLIIGVGWLFVRDRGAALIMVLPFFFLLLAAALQKYPAGERLALFVTPFLFLLMASGLGYLFQFVSHWNKSGALVVIGLLALTILWQPASTSFNFFLSPYMRSDIKPALAYIDQYDQPGDTIYIYNENQRAFEYYAPFFDFKEDHIVIGAESSNYKREVIQMKGKQRVWLVFSRYCNTCTSAKKQSRLIQLFGENGKELDMFRSAGTRLYLYDFVQ